MNTIEVIGLGALNMDNIYQVERILGDSETVVRESASLAGGSAANTIYGLTKLGVATGFIGAVGDDAEGERLRQDFQEIGVDTGQIRVKPEAKTGSTLCLSDESGQRSIYVLPGANNLLTRNDLQLDYVNQAKLLHISSFVDDAQFNTLLELVAKLAPSVRISFSPGALYAAKGLEALKPILARTHILFINRTELHQLTGDDVSSGAETCFGYGCRTVVVTLGKGTEYGLDNIVGFVISAENEYVIASDQKDTTPASDTTGAGDAFATGFLYGLLNDKSLEECGHLGDMVARFSIAKIGARQGLPTLKELARRYHERYGQEL